MAIQYQAGFNSYAGIQESTQTTSGLQVTNETATGFNWYSPSVTLATVQPSEPGIFSQFDGGTVTGYTTTNDSYTTTTGIFNSGYSTAATPFNSGYSTAATPTVTPNAPNGGLYQYQWYYPFPEPTQPLTQYPYNPSYIPPPGFKLVPIDAEIKEVKEKTVFIDKEPKRKIKL
jgi:hypothetical protein